MRFPTITKSLTSVAILGLMASAAATSAMADALKEIGVPVPDAIGLQPAASATAAQAHSLDHMLLWITGVIVVFVTLLLLIVIARFNSKSNPTAAKFTHNTPVEIVWTLVPILILVFIGSFSLPALFNQLEIPATDLTIKVTGNQWYWHYEYPDLKGDSGDVLGFDSNMIGNATTAEDGVTPYVMNDKMEAQLVKAGYAKSDFLLAVDNPLVVPVGKKIKVILTGSDVIHAWQVPAFAVMHSAVPGRLGELWFEVDAPGIYFGQCTTLCGKDHAYMPIEVKAVPQDVYDQWVIAAKAGNVQLAQN